MIGLALIFSTAFLVALTGAVMPGPLLTVTISETVNRGRSAALALITGHALLELFMVMALAFGLSKLLGAQVVVRAIGVIGGVFLLWMGVGIVKDVIVKKISLSATPGSSTGSGGVLVASGAATSLSNPYWTLWWATIGVGFLTKSMVQAGTSGLGVFYIGHILGDYVWYGIVGFAVAAGRRIFSDHVYRSTLLICGLFLILLAFSFIGDFKIF